MRQLAHPCNAAGLQLSHTLRVFIPYNAIMCFKSCDMYKARRDVIACALELACRSRLVQSCLAHAYLGMHRCIPSCWTRPKRTSHESRVWPGSGHVSAMMMTMRKPAAATGLKEMRFKVCVGAQSVWCSVAWQVCVAAHVVCHPRFKIQHQKKSQLATGWRRAPKGKKCLMSFFCHHDLHMQQLSLPTKPVRACMVGKSRSQST